MKLDYTLPSNDTHDFNGHLKLNKDPKREILSIDNFIPRGAINMSGWIYGLVVYAGNDTKIMLNSIYPRQKDSFLDIITKKIFYLTFFLSLFSLVFRSLLLWQIKKTLSISRRLTPVLFFRTEFSLTSSYIVNLFQLAFTDILTS